MIGTILVRRVLPLAWGQPANSLPFLALALIASSLLLLALTGYLTATGYEVQRMERMREALEHQNQQLEAEIASLRSLERVEREARTRFGMVPAQAFLYAFPDAALLAGLGVTTPKPEAFTRAAPR